MLLTTHIIHRKKILDEIEDRNDDLIVQVQSCLLCVVFDVESIFLSSGCCFPQLRFSSAPMTARTGRADLI